MGLRDSYRTSVFNDFSIVSKATFYGMKRNAAKPDDFDLDEILPVQLNPVNLTELSNCRIRDDFEKSALREAIRGTQAEKTEAPPMPKRPNPINLSIRLIYDIYDEYNVRTCDGATGLFDNISLNNPELTSLPKLIEYSHDPTTYVLFRWGSINFFGIITSIDCSYDAFSCWGQPLKCEATVNMKEIRIKDMSKNILDCFGSTFKKRVESHEGYLKTLQVGGAVGGVLTSELSGLLPRANRDF